jgi:hypothetical protein
MNRHRILMNGRSLTLGLTLSRRPNGERFLRNKSSHYEPLNPAGGAVRLPALRPAVLSARRLRTGWLAGLVLLAGLAAPAAPAGKMLTRWAYTVSAHNDHPEYPRPQFVRSRWGNLNGSWDYAITPDTTNAPEKYDGKILVPFPVESQLSGVKRRLDEHSRLWYRRQFTVPAAWHGQRVLLHFGAVDWETTVFLNGHKIGFHRGGYDGFSFDLTPELDWAHTNELVVSVFDPTEGDQPRGKQSRKPEGVFYTPSSGIWQTVWLEPVPPVHFTGVQLTSEFSAGAVRVLPFANTLEKDVRAEVVVRFAGREMARTNLLVGADTVVPLAESHPWSPEAPQLYDVTLTLRRGPTVLDEADSYFGLREIHVGTDDKGVRRLFLNGKPMFQMGVLDQGFWPDGLYTAPSDAAWRHDLETAKELGFNLVRKHVKVEPERWYYWADHLGLLVWQDMPSGNNATPAGRRDFRMELEQMLAQRRNHPCIVTWVLFNEGWGQFDTEQLTRWVKSVDPTRLVDNASGWTDAKVGDLIDVHSYPEPVAAPEEGQRAGVLGEFGGLGLPVSGHTWASQAWGYQEMSNFQKLTDHYLELVGKVWSLQASHRLAAAIYTQLTDVESEGNGLQTYDREVVKVNAVAAYQANQHLPAAIAGLMLLPDAEQGAYTWRYTTNSPAKNWMQPDFSDVAWPEGAGAFGALTPLRVFIRTGWKTSDIWLRREFTLAAAPSPNVKLVILHDEDAEVYLNGVSAARLPSYRGGYVVMDITPAARAALRAGRNLIAVHCHQIAWDQFIDAGLLDDSPVH